MKDDIFIANGLIGPRFPLNIRTTDSEVDSILEAMDEITKVMEETGMDFDGAFEKYRAEKTKELAKEMNTDEETLNKEWKEYLANKQAKLIANEQESRVKELDYDRFWKDLKDNQRRLSHSVLNDESTHYKLKFLTDISLTLALIYDEMRGITNDKES